MSRRNWVVRDRILRPQRDHSDHPGRRSTRVIAFGGEIEHFVVLYPSRRRHIVP
jgi:hypothetical protein